MAHLNLLLYDEAAGAIIRGQVCLHKGCGC